MEIAPGVHTIDRLGIGRAYLYQDGERLTLIDTGLPNSAERVLASVERLGRRPEDLRQIVVTHYHYDHAGSLAALVERTGARVLAGAADAPVVRGERPPALPNPSGGWRLLGPLLKRGARPPAPVRVDRELADGDEIDLGGGARAVHVPGHTPGSIAVFVPGRRLLFTGDAAVHVRRLGLPAGLFGLFTEDAARARESFRRLAELEFDVACFGHGPPLLRGASAAFRAFAQRPV